MPKEYVRSFKSGSDYDEEEDTHSLLESLIMTDGITIGGQTIDTVLGEILKSLCKDDCGTCIATKYHPFAPSRQLCAQNMVSVWGNILAKFVKKSRVMAQCKSLEDASREAEATEISGMQMSSHSQKEIFAEIAPLIDGDYLQHCLADDDGCEDGNFNDEDF